MRQVVLNSLSFEKLTDLIGKVILAPYSEKYPLKWKHSLLLINNAAKIPIFISETEEINVGDYAYCSWSLAERKIFKVKELDERLLAFIDTNNYFHPIRYSKKILILPEDLSTDQLSLIQNKKIIENENINVEFIN